MNRKGKPRSQFPEKKFTFVCGCTGILPYKGKSNKLAKWGTGRGWVCRVAKIFATNFQDSVKGGFVAINQNTPHSTIRKMMEEKFCWRCGEPLKWEFGLGKTPHLHHSHKTGEPLGFTHSRCNPNAMEHEIDSLKAEITRLRKDTDAKKIECL